MLYRLQDASLGFVEMIEQIMDLAETRLKKLDQRRRETVPASELILGMQCGGSDAFSGITANPALAMPPTCWSALAPPCCSLK